jgi:hypothetical protein
MLNVIRNPEDTGHYYNLEATPPRALATASRSWIKTGIRINNGGENLPYYTNSTSCPSAT